MKKLLFIIVILAFGLTGYSHITWTGATDTDWATPGNWNPSTVPTFFDHVIIPDVTTDPVIGSGTTDAICNNLTINSGASLTVNGELDYLGDVTVNGTFDVNGIVETATVTSSTGETWMDRNLGASQVATASNDEDAYGDLYQWGRATEGHERRTSLTTSTNATTAVPNAGNSWDGLFITESVNPFDWLTPQDNTLWLGASGTNNPCPDGFRLPTEAEWEAERSSWQWNDDAGAYASPLKLVVGGWRMGTNGSLNWVGSNGYYWSSSINGGYALYLHIDINAGTSSKYRAYSFSVRCIRD